MTRTAPDDPLLRDFKTALIGLYGDDIARIVLFGSRARGDATGESDYDVAVFLKSPPDQRTERRRLANLRVEFIDRIGIDFDSKVFPDTAYDDRTPLMLEIRRDGVEL